MTTEVKFQPGFRISAIDAAVLCVAATGSWIAAGIDPWMGIAIAFVVAHFFLFCNVVRMRRSLELPWAALFVLLAGATVLTGVPGRISTFSMMLVCTAVSVTLQMRQPSYHGIFWQQINPRLPHWWEKQSGKS
jgi:hypothetical protein